MRDHVGFNGTEDHIHFKNKILLCLYFLYDDVIVLEFNITSI